MAKEQSSGEERRRHPRIKSLNLISYVNMEGEVQLTPELMARALNISLSGVKMEVYEEINVGSEMEMEIAIDESIFTVRGKVVYARQVEGGITVLGVEFSELQEDLAAMLA